VPTSVHPLSDPATAEIDKDLLGVWAVDGEENFTVLHVTEGITGQLEVVMVVHKDKGYELSQLRAFSSHIAGAHCLNIQLIEDAQASPELLFARYELAGGDALKLFLPDAEWLSKAIEDKKLAGEVGRSGDGAMQTIKLTATTDELAKFFEAHSAEMFKETRVLKRMVAK